ncbi:MAG: hypothetical protein SO238_03280, partial [Treponema sp.]|nr:hypothetical protein [Treponema sp.]
PAPPPPRAKPPKPPKNTRVFYFEKLDGERPPTNNARLTQTVLNFVNRKLYQQLRIYKTVRGSEHVNKSFQRKLLSLVEA